MSRIAGLVGPGGLGASSGREVRSMLAVLPGACQRTVDCGLGTFGWVGASAGRAGGVAMDGEIAIAIDGTVLNGADLTRNLHRSANDPRFLTDLYTRHGFRDAVARLHGDYSIALYDGNSHTLWLARDRFGVKPLYYTITENAFVFASQPRALLSLSSVSAEVNSGFVARFAGSHYRTFDNVPTESPLASISQLPASCIVSFDGRRVSSPISYWALEERGEWSDSEDELAEQYKERLLRAVSQRTRIADRPAFTLSGGLDSSSVLCCAEKASGKKRDAVSCIYTDAMFDEREEIADVVSEKVSEWRAIEIPNQINVIELVDRMVRIHDEPVATATWLSHLLLCEDVAERGFDSLFGGLGGDELNAGEYEYFPYFFADLKVAGRQTQLEEEITAWMGHHDHPIYRKDAEVATAMMNRLVDYSVPGRCLPDRNRLLRYANAVNPEYWELEDFEPAMDIPFRSYLKNRTYQDIFRETLPCCLRAEDRQCAESGIAHFDPFLDHELVEFMFRVPGTLKIRDGVTKHLLRLTMRDILPEATRLRVKKTGWNAPAHQWFSGRTLNELRDIVSSRRFRERDIYETKVVSDIIDEHERIVQSGESRENHMMFLWQLLNLHLWLSALEERPRMAA